MVRWLDKKIKQSSFLKFRIKVDLDLMATPGNKKTTRYISNFPFKDSNRVGIDALSPDTVSWLSSQQTLYLFPPKNVATKTLDFVFNYLTKYKVLMIIHIFGEWPVGLGQFKKLKKERLSDHKKVTLLHPWIC